MNLVLILNPFQLNESADQRGAGAFCLSVGASEESGVLRFTHRIEEKIGTKSYGLEVAKLAGLPTSLISRAEYHLDNIEVRSISNVPSDRSDHLFKVELEKLRKEVLGLNLIKERSEQLLSKLSQIDINNVTPIQALNILIDIQDLASK